MVSFQELKIDSEGKTLIIDVTVKDLEYYENVYLDTIYIDTQDTYVSGTPSSNPVYSNTLEGNNKNVRLEITEPEIPSLKDNLFFIYIRTKGDPTPNTPCGMDISLVLGAVLYPYTIYYKMLKVLQLEYRRCSIPKRFIDSFFRYKALQFALTTGSNLDAISYFNTFKDLDTYIKENCNCNGS